MSNAFSEPVEHRPPARPGARQAALWFLRSQLDEVQRTFDWLKSWGTLEATATPFNLVNPDVHTERITP